jgi:hypothetical protein
MKKSNRSQKVNRGYSKLDNILQIPIQETTAVTFHPLETPVNDWYRCHSL